MTGLSDRDVDVLTFEALGLPDSAAKVEAVRELFDMTPTRYLQVLNAATKNPAAAAIAPRLVKRVRAIAVQRPGEGPHSALIGGRRIQGHARPDLRRLGKRRAAPT